MEKEQIVKALECCVSGTCGGCAFYDAGEFGDIEKCTVALVAASISLHREQEKRIEELEAENEKLKKPRYMVYSDGKIEMIPSLESVRADTVRKMRDLIEERCIKGGIYPALVKNTINKVAEELLEGGTEDEPAQP